MALLLLLLLMLLPLLLPLLPLLLREGTWLLRLSGRTSSSPRPL